MSDRPRKGGEGGGRHGERQRGDSKMEVKPPNREAGDGPVPNKEGRER